VPALNAGSRARVGLGQTPVRGFVNRWQVQLHLTPADADETQPTGGFVYISVTDVAALRAESAASGVEGRFNGPHDTPYGLRVFVCSDPDGIVRRVGSPL